MNVVFDWAGTLADDLELTWSLTEQTIRACGGASLELDAYRREFALPAAGFYARYCPGVAWEEIEGVFAGLCRKQYPPAVRLWPGVQEGLACLACRNRLYLLSSLDQGVLEAALERLGLRRLFREVKGSAADKAAALPGLLTQWGLAQDETVAVGDTAHDVAAAGAAGVQALAAGYGYGDAAALAAAGAEGVYGSFAGIQRHLDKLACAESRYFPVATVGGLIYDEGGRVLLVRTRKWSGLYGIPGGKVDYGETLEAAFVREVREETGLEISGLAFVLNQDCVEHPEFYRPRHFILVNYVAKTAGASPRVRLNHESDDYRWESPRAALGLPLNQPTRFLIEKLLEREGA